ncbi:MAG: VWA domain-containing protein [Candidatus Paceibacterota bacterium]|jgi:uncharacterized protein YegL
MRRLPVYLLIDTSGSMRGEAIASVNVGLNALISCLRKDPYATESACISIITFDKDVNNILPLTEIPDIQLPEITTPESGPTHLGKALELLCQKISEEVILSTKERKGDWMPILFIMTDGKPSDIALYRKMVVEVKRRKFASIIACAAGNDAKAEYLKELTDNVISLDTTDSATFSQYFKWVSDIVGLGGRSMGATESLVLPAQPPELHLVI